GAQDGSELVDYDALDVARSDPADRSGRGATFEHVHVDVVPVELPVAARVARRHGRAARGEDEPLEQGRGAGAATGSALARVLFKDVLNALPQRAIDDRLVLAGVGRPLV